MDELISTLSATTLGGGIKQMDGVKMVSISEISSPTRLYLQTEEQGREIDLLSKDLSLFYRERACDGFRLRAEDVSRGMKLAAYAVKQISRAEVIEEVREGAQTVRVFFMDYGTIFRLNLNCVQRLMEPFTNMRTQAIRGALYGIKPRGNARLWDLTTISNFIDQIRSKVQEVHKIKIVKYHPNEDFYEFLLYDVDGITINEKLINEGRADLVNEEDPLCLTYPSFEMLEKSIFYPTFEERCWVLERFSVNLNHFEEALNPSVKSKLEYENELMRVLADPRNSNIKNVFTILVGR